MVWDSKLDVCGLFWEVAAGTERQRQSCVSLRAAGHLPWPLWQPLHKLNKKCYMMVSSSIPQRPAGEAEPTIRKMPSKAVTPPPPRVRQQSLQCPEQLYQKSWHLQQHRHCLLMCFYSEKETSQQLHSATQVSQMGSGRIRAAFNQTFSVLTIHTSAWGGLQPAAGKTVPCVVSEVTAYSHSCSCKKWPADWSLPLNHEAGEGCVLGQTTWRRDAGSQFCASFPWFSAASCLLSFISSSRMCFYYSKHCHFPILK